MNTSSNVHIIGKWIICLLCHSFLFSDYMQLSLAMHSFFYLFSFTDILGDRACSLCYYCLLGSLVRPKVVRSVHYCPQTKKTLVRRYTDLTSLDAFPTSSVYPTKVTLVFGLNLHYLIFVTILTVNCPCVDFFWCYKVEVFMGVLWHLRRLDRVSCVIKVRWSMSLDKTSQLC